MVAEKSLELSDPAFSSVAAGFVVNSSLHSLKELVRPGEALLPTVAVSKCKTHKSGQHMSREKSCSEEEGKRTVEDEAEQEIGSK